MTCWCLCPSLTATQTLMHLPLKYVLAVVFFFCLILMPLQAQPLKSSAALVCSSFPLISLNSLHFLRQIANLKLLCCPANHFHLLLLHLANLKLLRRRANRFHLLRVLQVANLKLLHRPANRFRWLLLLPNLYVFSMQDRIWLMFFLDDYC